MFKDISIEIHHARIARFTQKYKINCTVATEEARETAVRMFLFGKCLGAAIGVGAAEVN